MTLEDVKGKECYIGIDLSSGGDLTTVSIVVPLEDGLMSKELYNKLKNIESGANKTDIIDNLTSGGVNRALSAEQGKNLKLQLDKTYSKSESDKLLNKKVEKVEGQGLSDENYTLPEKSKLKGIESNANNYKHPNTHSASMITETNTRKWVSPEEKEKWNSSSGSTGGNKIEIVDDLTTGGASKALSAEQGKILENNKISYVTDDIHSFIEKNKNIMTICPVFDATNITDMSGMFRDCVSLTTVPKFDASNVTNMRYMFKGCVSLTTVPHFDTSSVISMNRMFQHCTSLEFVPKLNIDNVKFYKDIFAGCKNLDIDRMREAGWPEEYLKTAPNYVAP